MVQPTSKPKLAEPADRPGHQRGRQGRNIRINNFNNSRTNNLVADLRKLQFELQL